MRDEHREALKRYVVAIQKGARPQQADEALVVLLVRAELGDPTAREVLESIGLRGARGRPKAYGPHVELRDRALALEVALHIYDGLSPKYAIEEVARGRRKSKRDVEAAVDDYQVPRYDDALGKPVRDYDDLVATLVPDGAKLAELRRRVDNLWRAYHQVKPRRKSPTHTKK